MCGEETTPTATPRIGARVDFFSPTGHLGNLLFLNPSTPSSTQATHVRFQQSNPNPRPSTPNDDDDQVLVSIQYAHPIPSTPNIH
jgi:hypothetical protein